MKWLVIFLLTLTSYISVNAQCDGFAGNDTTICDPYELWPDGLVIGSLDSTITIENYSFEWTATFDSNLLWYNQNYNSVNQILSDINTLNPTISQPSRGTTTLILKTTDSLSNVCLDTVLVKIGGVVACLAECRHGILEGESITLSNYCAYPIVEPVFVNQITVTPTETTSYNILMVDGIGCEYYETCTVMIYTTNIIEYGLSEIKILKNPFGNKLAFAIDELKNFNLQYQIVNSNGQILNVAELEKYNHLDTSSFSSGIYFLKIVEEGQTLKTIKLIKSN